MTTKHEPYYVPAQSAWPIIGAIGLFLIAFGAGSFVSELNSEGGIGGYILLAGIAVIIFMIFGWFRTVIAESMAGLYSKQMDRSFRQGMSWFIFSEVMFFVAWFWAFFDASLFADEVQQFARVEYTGGHWPPTGIEVFDPWHLPLINTIILLTSGTTVTWAHHALLHNDRNGLKWGLLLTVLLGALFSVVQAYEYSHAAFGFTQGIYSSTFYMATGFHGFHVLVGTIFLIVCLVRAMKGDFKPEKHFGFESAAWYWHFVDVVWLILFVFVYWL